MRWFGIPVLALLTGCGSIIHGTHQRVVLDVRPAGAVVHVAQVDLQTGIAGVGVYRSSPWLDVELRRARTHRVTATMGDARTEVILTPTLSGWMWGNLIWFPLGGPLGVGIALAVDWAIGGIWELEPDPVIINLTSPGGK